jgi:hypothetical protein
MHEDRIAIGEETGAKKTFVWALEWPGWCRAGKDASLAIDALIEHGPRYAVVAREAGLAFPDVSANDVSIVETVPGGGGTDFGVPGEIAPSDRRPVDASEADRLVSLIEAAWARLDEIVARAPAELRKGPRGGGRDRDKVFAHVIAAEGGYAQVMGIKRPEVDPTDGPAIEELRGAMIAALRKPSDGSPIAGRRWPPRYATRRIAWHVLDHAWEIEDRTER